MGGVPRDPSPRTARTVAGVVLALLALVSVSAASCSSPPKDVSVGSPSRADVTEVVDASAAVTSRDVIASVQRGFASVGQAMSALTAAQRAQAQAAYDAAKSTVDALTLTAPIAGVVQLGGKSSAASGPSLSDLLGAAGAGA